MSTEITIANAGRWRNFANMVIFADWRQRVEKAATLIAIGRRIANLIGFRRHPLARLARTPMVRSESLARFMT